MDWSSQVFSTKNPDRVCFSSRAHAAGLHRLFVFVFLLTFSYFQDVAFREENDSVLSAVCRKMGCEGALAGVRGPGTWCKQSAETVTGHWGHFYIRRSSFLGAQSHSMAKAVWAKGMTIVPSTPGVTG